VPLRSLAAHLRNVALFAFATALSASCTRAPVTQSSGARLVIAQAQEPTSLDPLFMEGPSVAIVAPLIYSGLLTVDGAGRLQPQLAARVPSLENGGISPDGLTITYRLRPGIRWQDGVPLDASDVAFTFAAIMNPKNNVPSRFGYETIRSVEAVGKRVVRVHLLRRYAPILSLFMAPDQNFSVLPRHLLARYGDLNTVPFNVMPIGSGPYRVAEWAHGDHLRLVRNAAYFGGVPRLAQIDLKFVPDSSAVLNQLRTGEVDAAFLADPSFLDAYRSIEADRVTRVRQTGFGDLLFNTQAAGVSDARVRRALVESLDIARLVRNVTKGAQTSDRAGRGVFGWAYDPAIGPPGYDRPAGQRLFANAGWRRDAAGILRKGGRPLELDLAFPSGNGVANAVAVDVQQELQAAGVTLVLRPYTPSFFRAPASAGGPLFGGKFALAFFEVFGTSDPDTHWLLGCSESAPHGFNVQRFCDATLDEAQMQGTSTYDPAARRRYSAVVQRRVADELPFVPLYQTDAVNVYRRDLLGVKSSPLSPFWNVADWSLAR
jgi:peptide/nickel transport system substrate-binding protein